MSPIGNVLQITPYQPHKRGNWTPKNIASEWSMRRKNSDNSSYWILLYDGCEIMYNQRLILLEVTEHVNLFNELMH